MNPPWGEYGDTRAPFYGSRKITEQFRRDEHMANRNHVQRMMRGMGLQAIYQKPCLSEPHPGHKIYPCLLRNVVIDRKDQV